MTTAIFLDQEIYQENPIRNDVFFAIPRKLALREDISDRLFRLMSILYSAFGDDGYIEYKLHTLSKLLNKSIRSTKEVIKEAVEKGLIIRKLTGRSIIFQLVKNPPLKKAETASASAEKVEKSALLCIILSFILIREAETCPTGGRKSAPLYSLIKENKKRKLAQPKSERPRDENKRATADCLKKIRNKLPKESGKSIGNTILVRGLNQHGLRYMLWLADECKNKPNYIRYFCKGVHHREDFNKYDRKIVREGENDELKKKLMRQKDDERLAEIIKKPLFGSGFQEYAQ